MAINHKTSTNSRISVPSAGPTVPALASFVVCPMGANFIGSPLVSCLTIYQMAYQQAKIAARQASNETFQNWSQN